MCDVVGADAVGAVGHPARSPWRRHVDMGMSAVFFGASVPLIAACTNAALGGPNLHGPVLCTLRQMAGIPCPACGMTTSFTFLAGGRIGDAFVASPLGPVLFALLGALAVWAFRRMWRGEAFPDVDGAAIPLVVRRWWIWVPPLVIAMMAYQYLRIEVWHLYV